MRGPDCICQWRGHRVAISANAASARSAIARRLYPSLHDQHEQQLPAANLRPFDYKRAALVQLCVHLQQKLLFLEKLQVQNIARFGLSPGIDMQREIFAGSQPIFLAGSERFAGLADDLELIVAEKFFQRSRSEERRVGKE